MTTIERLVGSFLIGNTEPILKKFSYSSEKFNKEKDEALKKISQKSKLTESNIKEQQKFIFNLEKLAHRLSNSIEHSINPYNIFKDIPNMMIVYDHKFKVLDFNKSFLDTFCSNNSCNSSVFNMLNGLEKTNIINEKIKIYGKIIDYEKEFLCKHNNINYKVTTTPVFDSENIFDFFVQIYTKI